jgi:hypothetical protein
MRRLLLALFLANFFLSLLSCYLLPGEMAVHFGRGGRPDGWAPCWINLLLLLGLELPLFALFYFFAPLARRLPPRWLRLPGLRGAAPGPAQLQVVNGYMEEYGAALFAFLLAAGLLTLAANLSEPVGLNQALFLAALSFFLLYTLLWTVRLVRALRAAA